MKKDFGWNAGARGDRFPPGRDQSYLRRFWPELNAARGGEVFVPLCGKSLDMVWLRQQGCYVLGGS